MAISDPTRNDAPLSGTSPHPHARVIGTQDASPLLFWAAISPGRWLQLDDVVTCAREVPGIGRVTIAGIVTDVRARHEGVSFGSDVFDVHAGVLPAQVQELAEVSVTRVDPECYVPPLPTAGVVRATGADRDAALYFDQMGKKVVVGLGRDGQPVYLNLEFLDGTRGAHVSISGVSGVATKTSFALFLLHSLFTGGALESRAKNSHALVFSVKGEDLLHIDRINAGVDDELRDAYARLGLAATPFASVSFHAPSLPGARTGAPHVTSRTSGVHAFWWTLTEFCRDQMLPFVFTDAEDDRQQYTAVIHTVAARLAREHTAHGSDGAVQFDNPVGGPPVVARTYADLVDLIDDRVNDDATRAAWAGAATTSGSIGAFIRRLRSSVRHLDRLIRGDLPDAATRHIQTTRQVTVVDLHQLHDRAQRFVVGVVLAAETARKEEAGPGSLLFCMLDELNKYAPREGASPIKDVLLDIAERGRSLGVILIGAQQTASEVERRILANSAIRVVGRLDSAEASRQEYGFLPPSQRARAQLAKPGAMFITQPEIPVPLAVEFPFPAWATRPSEDGGTPTSSADAATGPPADPFKGLPSPDLDLPPF